VELAKATALAGEIWTRAVAPGGWKARRRQRRCCCAGADEMIDITTTRHGDPHAPADRHLRDAGGCGAWPARCWPATAWPAAGLALAAHDSFATVMAVAVYASSPEFPRLGLIRVDASIRPWWNTGQHEMNRPSGRI